MTKAKYSCAACCDTRQGEPIESEAEYVARDNVPKYWALCRKHYERADAELKEHYEPMGAFGRV